MSHFTFHIIIQSLICLCCGTRFKKNVKELSESWIWPSRGHSGYSLQPDSALSTHHSQNSSAGGNSKNDSNETSHSFSFIHFVLSSSQSTKIKYTIAFAPCLDNHAGNPGSESVPVEGDDIWGLHLPHLVHGIGLAHGHLFRHLDPHHVCH